MSAVLTRRTVHPSLVLVLTAICTMLLAGATWSQDWNQWRGSARDGLAVNFEPPGEWPERLELVWEARVGRGDSSPLVVGDRVYTWTREGDEEIAAARSLSTGDVVWESRVSTPYKAMTIVREHGAGPFSSPALLDGRFVAVGILGTVTAWDAESGDRLWSYDPSSEFKPSRPFYGASQSPLMWRDQVVASVGGHAGGALIAFDAESGRESWRLELEGPSYGSGVVAQVGGQELLITPTRRRLIGVDLDTGEQLWEFPYTVKADDWSQTPLVVGDTVTISSGAGPALGLRLAKGDSGWAVEERWSSNEFWLRFSSPVLIGEYALAFADQKKGHLVAFDPQDGDVVWSSEPRQGENAWIVGLPEGALAAFNDGRVQVLSIVGDAVEVVRTYEDLTDSEVWAHPAISGHHLVIKDAESLKTYSLLTE